jgi:hypothetical protein
MQIIAQSQTPTKISYIHLAYIAAQLNKGISKGELIPVQAMLGAAMATAVACGVIGVKLAAAGRRGRAAKVGAALGFIGTLFVLGVVQGVWRESRSNDQVVKHIIETKQWWALREPPIAAGVEAAALTNGTAASMAASYYGLKGGSGKEAPELMVKAFRYCELAAAQGRSSGWVRAGDLTNSPHLIGVFQAALEKGKLTEAERNWTTQQLAQMTARFEAK